MSLPRMRGDRPSLAVRRSVLVMFTPHARGSTYAIFFQCFFGLVYPACAGIDPDNSLAGHLLIGLPRMRGDRPSGPWVTDYEEMFTPHARGSTWAVEHLIPTDVVYPACAGIDPFRLPLPGHSARLPRMRGDRPIIEVDYETGEVFTPHARGSTLSVLGPKDYGEVYPACAGIDPGGY